MKVYPLAQAVHVTAPVAVGAVQVAQFERPVTTTAPIVPPEAHETGALATRPYPEAAVVQYVALTQTEQPVAQVPVHPATADMKNPVEHEVQTLMLVLAQEAHPLMAVVHVLWLRAK